MLLLHLHTSYLLHRRHREQLVMRPEDARATPDKPGEHRINREHLFIRDRLDWLNRYALALLRR
jgi:hypothetical protein